MPTRDILHKDARNSRIFHKVVFIIGLLFYGKPGRSFQIGGFLHLILNLISGIVSPHEIITELINGFEIDSGIARVSNKPYVLTSNPVKDILVRVISFWISIDVQIHRFIVWFNKDPKVIIFTWYERYPEI